MAATLIGLSGMVGARAQTDAEVDALIAEALHSSPWETLFTASSGLGYCDNIYLAHADPLGRPFFRVGGELLLLRLAPSEFNFNFFANGEARLFFGDGTPYQSYTLFSQAQLERNFSAKTSGTLAGVCFYQNQVLDLSVTETNRESVPVRGITLALRPGLRQQLSARSWLELEVPLTHQFFADTLDDYGEAGPRLTLGLGDRNGSRVTLTYDALWRAYSTDPELTATGAPIPGTQRQLFRQEVRLGWREFWDTARHWNTTLSGGSRWNTENGDGYSDFNQVFASAELGWQSHGWTVTASGRFAFYQYLTQTVSPTDPDKRNRTEWGCVVNIERQLTEKLSWITNYEFEVVGSNNPLETYTVNTISTSLQWEF